MTNQAHKTRRNAPSKLRITAGAFKNTPLKVPDSARPVMERVKLAIFSVIDEHVDGAECLDLFAGSGNLGLEALSRGAASCDFVDDDFFSIKYIKENLEKIQGSFGAEIEFNVNKEDSLKYVANSDKSYDIIFIDPPYDQNNHKHLFKLVNEIIKPNGIIVYLSNHTNKILEDLEEINANLTVIDSRKYGITHVDIIKIKDKEHEVKL
jgi:16S rRNA (guanine966-N2)-methyltransferase